MKEAILVGSIGSLKSACIMAGTFFAARELGIEIVGMAGASGGSIPIPLLAQNMDKDVFLHNLSMVNKDKLCDIDIVQQGLDTVLGWVGIERKGDAPFTGILRGNGLRSELSKLYGRAKCSKFEDADIPFIVVASLVAPDKTNLQNNPAAAFLYAIGQNQEIVFSAGDVVAPIRASASIPLIFRPEIIKNIGALVDGGVVDAIPIYPAMERFGVYDVIMADATNDIFEDKIFSSDIDSLIDVAIATVYATVRDSTLVRIRRADEILKKHDKKLIRVCPKNVKLKMFDIDKVPQAVEAAYGFALNCLKNQY